MKTWEKVAEEYSKQNPGESIDRYAANRIGNRAINKIKKLLQEDEELNQDLLEFLEEGVSHE